MAICIYPPNAEDFTTNGLGILTPLECTVEEVAAGKYELELVHPIDNTLRWMQIAGGCIVKVPAPVRENPLYEAPAMSEPVTITRQVWVVSGTSHGLYIRTGPGMKYKRIGVKKNGVQVLELEDAADPWKKVCVLNSGQVGYMSTKYLRPLRTETEVIEPAKPVGSSILKISQSREQLFRIYSVEQDSEAATVTAKALHVFYDDNGNLINADYEIEEGKGKDVNVVMADITAKLAVPPETAVHALNLTGKIVGDFGYKSPVEAYLDPDDGIVAQTNAMLIRDNWEAYMLPDMVRDRGVTVRRGKNLIGVEVTNDISSVVTRIIPVGKNKNGDPLYLSGTKWIDSPHINDYRFPRIKRIEYDVQTGKDGFGNDNAVRNEVKRLAQEDFSKNGVDLPKYGMDVDFVLLGNVPEYADYASLQAVHLYDTVTVIDEMLGLKAKVRVTGYTWNCLTEQYEKVTLGELQDVKQTVYSYNLPNAGVSGSKIMNNSLGGTAIRNASIEYAKIAVAAIEQLTADSIVALTARIQELVAGSVTTDELYAGIADITKATVETADINWASINELNAAIATLVQANIGTADIDFAHIKDMVTDTAIITEGVGGQLFISRLAVTEANMVSLTTGELVVKGEDGRFYSLGVDAQGNVITTLKQLNNDDVQDLSINAGQKLVEGSVTAACLNAREIFADNAVIRSLIAANLDVDALFAREAFINLLRTGKIIGDKSIEMIAGEAEDAKAAANNAQASVDDLNRLTDIEVIEGTFVQAERREGEGIHMYSEIKPKQDLKWGPPWPGGGGKNLIPSMNAEVYETRGVKFVRNADGSITVNGLATNYATILNDYIDAVPLRGKTLTIKGAGTKAVVTQMCIQCTSGTVYKSCVYPNENALTFVMPEDANTARFEIYVSNGQSPSSVVVYPQLELGSDSTDYAPYANTPPIEGWTGMNAGACGKNLLNNTASTQTVNGVTFTVNANGTVTANGTATANAAFLIPCSLIIGKTYTLSGCPANGGIGKYLMQISYFGNDYGNGITAIATEKTGPYVTLFVYAGVTVSNLKFRPMLELGSTATPYAPYTGKTYALDFGETVYGGRVNWNKGEMLVTREVLVFDGSDDEVWSNGYTSDGVNNRFQIALVDKKFGDPSFLQGPVKPSCSAFAYDRTSAIPPVGKFRAQQNNVSGVGLFLLFNPPTSLIPLENISAWRTWLAANPIQVEMPLYEPYTIQLTPVQIESLEGINTVYTDADGGRVEFGHKLHEVIDSTMPPASATVGTLWLDRSVTPAVLRRYNGSDWEAVNDMSMLEEVQSALLTKQAELEAAQRESALFLKLDAVNKVVRIGQEKVTSEFLIDAFGSGVSVNNEIFSRFEANRAVFGYMEMRKPAVGGLAFDSIKT